MLVGPGRWEAQGTAPGPAVPLPPAPSPPRARVRVSAFTSSRAPSARGVQLPWRHPRMLPAATASPGHTPWPWLSFLRWSLQYGEPALRTGTRQRAPMQLALRGARRLSCSAAPRLLSGSHAAADTVPCRGDPPANIPAARCILLRPTRPPLRFPVKGLVWRGLCFV